MPKEERLNCLTHLLGLVLALAGAVALVVRAIQGGGVAKITSFTVFGVSMILLYASSTLFHGSLGSTKARWAKADHCAIYLLIAGTYTPLSLVTLHGALGWALFGFVWSLAALGIGRELWWGRAVPALPLYLAMGWCGVVAAMPLLRGLHAQGVAWLLTGCICYSVGVVFYVLGRRLPHAHGIWHLFVMGGTASNCVTVLRFVS